MDNFLISLPYMYPVCPVSIDHARLFVIADIIARYHRETHNVLFPIAAHYSGVTADIIMDKIGKQNQETINLYVNYYNEYYGAAEPPVRCGESHLSGLTEPLRSL